VRKRDNFLEQKTEWRCGKKRKTSSAKEKVGKGSGGVGGDGCENLTTKPELKTEDSAFFSFSGKD